MSAKKSKNSDPEGPEATTPTAPEAKEPASQPAETPQTEVAPEPKGLPEIFFATGNPKKLEEIREILGSKFTIKSFEDLPEKLEVEETEDTLAGNALLKANAYFEKVNLPTFADDTGLEVAALNGAPGVFSARYAGPEGDSAKNTAKLMNELRSKTDRSATFRTVIAFVDGKNNQTFEGSLKGEISIFAAGENGFGYDPVFIPQGSDYTLAELSADEKNKISHRSKALEKFVAFLNK
ncbi:MAG: RdgB/HAM1 family non-canonical purine NTP pyrophosphatase [Bacteroidia bacterium]|nr:RdgB/HAM1 family non-canonical purine NTP pyrophosphatase [Bacteroidia bacterium]